MIAAFNHFESDTMPPSKKARVTFLCSHEARKFLEIWADKEGRTISNLVERIVLAAISEQESEEVSESKG